MSDQELADLASIANDPASRPASFMRTKEKHVRISVIQEERSAHSRH